VALPLLSWACVCVCVAGLVALPLLTTECPLVAELCDLCPLVAELCDLCPLVAELCELCPLVAELCNLCSRGPIVDIADDAVRSAVFFMCICPRRSSRYTQRALRRWFSQAPCALCALCAFFRPLCSRGALLQLRFRLCAMLPLCRRRALLPASICCTSAPFPLYAECAAVLAPGSIWLRICVSCISLYARRAAAPVLALCRVSLHVGTVRCCLLYQRRSRYARCAACAVARALRLLTVLEAQPLRLSDSDSPPCLAVPHR
jgi:hypothetical protein